MAFLDWLLPPKPKVVRKALDEHAAAVERLRRAYSGEDMTIEQSMDDLRGAFEPKRNGKAQ